VKRADLIDREKQRVDLLRTAESFRRAMIESGAVNHVSQDRYIDQLRALERALNTDNYRPRRAASAPMEEAQSTTAVVTKP
jgi:hypothetical protein